MISLEKNTMIIYIAFGHKFFWRNALGKSLHVQAKYYKLSLRLHSSFFEKPGPEFLLLTELVRDTEAGVLQCCDVHLAFAQQAFKALRQYHSLVYRFLVFFLTLQINLKLKEIIITLYIILNKYFMIIDISVVFTAYGITALMQGFLFSYLKNLFRNQTLHTSRI